MKTFSVLASLARAAIHGFLQLYVSLWVCHGHPISLAIRPGLHSVSHVPLCSHMYHYVKPGVHKGKELFSRDLSKHDLRALELNLMSVMCQSTVTILSSNYVEMYMSMD